jgi:hypothetical protein
LKARNTSPNSTLAGTNPSQKITKMKVGAKLAVELCTPSKPV